MLTAMGAIGALDVDAVPAALDRPGAPSPSRRSFYLQETSRDRLPAFFAAARERGLTTSFDTNWDPTDRWDGGVDEMLRASDVFFPNAAEARRIAGVDDVDEAATGPRRDRLDRAFRRRPDRRGQARRRRARSPVGPTGRIVRVPAMPVQPTDTTGAGDSFDAGLPAGVARRRRPPREPRARGRLRRAVDATRPAAWTARRRWPRRASDRRRGRPDERPRRRPARASGCSSLPRTRRSTGSTRSIGSCLARSTGRWQSSRWPAARASTRRAPRRRSAARSRPSGSSPVGPATGSWSGWLSLESTRGLARATGETRTCVSVLDRSSGAMTEIYERGERDRARRPGTQLEAIVGAELERGDVAAVCALRQPAARRAARRLRPDRQDRVASRRDPSPSSPTPTDRRLPRSSRERPAIVKVNAAEAGEASGDRRWSDAQSAAQRGRRHA